MKALYAAHFARVQREEARRLAAFERRLSRIRVA